MIAVTGAAGQLGRVVVQLLQQQGVPVWGYDRLPGTAFPCPYTVIDLTAPPASFSWPVEIDSVLHLAGYREVLGFSTNAAQTILAANLQTTATALSACVRVRRFVYVSSLSVYAGYAQSPFSETSLLKPESLYAISKWLGELACRMFQATHPACQVTILRLAQVYGPGSPEHLAIYRLIDSALSGRLIALDCSRDLRRDFIYLDDAAMALALAIQMDLPGVYNVGSGQPVSMQELANTIVDACDHPVAVMFGDQQGVDRTLNCQAFRAATGFEPAVSLQEGVAREVARMARRVQSQASKV